MLTDLMEACRLKFSGVVRDILELDIPDERVILSPVDDKETHFQLLEMRLKAESRRVALPFAAVSRVEVPQLHLARLTRSMHGYFEEVQIQEPLTGEVHLTRATPIEVEMTLTCYVDDLVKLDTAIARYMLSFDGILDKMTFSPECLRSASIDAVFTFDAISVVPASLPGTRQEAPVFSMVIPFTVISTLVAPVTTGPVILDTVVGIHATSEG